MLHVTGCIPRDSPPVIQTAAAINAGDFAATLLAAALAQAGIALGSSSKGTCSSSGWTWSTKHISPPLAVLMNHTLQQR